MQHAVAICQKIFLTGAAFTGLGIAKFFHGVIVSLQFLLRF
jgi:hypothetical protein